MTGSRLRMLGALSALVLAAGCANAAGHERPSSRDVTVVAAASLQDAFRTIAAAFERGHPGVHVTASYAGSQTLVAQVREGAPADVVATADTATMARLHPESPAVTFARNTLEIAVAPGNPRHVRGLADLARRDLVVVLAAPQVPAGGYTAAALRAAHVTVRPASLEDNVRGVLTKVELGEADAGVVYATDVRSAGSKVTGVPVGRSPTAAYPIVARTAAGRAFVDFVLSSEGLRILEAAGFMPP